MVYSSRLYILNIHFDPLLLCIHFLALWYVQGNFCQIQKIFTVNLFKTSDSYSSLTCKLSLTQ